MDSVSSVPVDQLASYDNASSLLASGHHLAINSMTFQESFQKSKVIDVAYVEVDVDALDDTDCDDDVEGVWTDPDRRIAAWATCNTCHVALAENRRLMNRSFWKRVGRAPQVGRRSGWSNNRFRADDDDFWREFEKFRMRVEQEEE
ncbi:hypothetical protein GCK72_001916 [Caenorhabditis remanei]|uniref:Uncharacterized protein n=1 Tax=Caenorhabditis remanei TaxID=31234 RepID=A0A6A5HQB7_CAERE|nr:hypothetical protein GCK72_001916 [Caenorhabditis remanei]KAF1770098.1 hypothetical protein GCK72_001916 [Caenorhabditis remanei]